MVQTYDILNLYYQNFLFELFKVYGIIMQRYRN